MNRGDAIEEEEHDVRQLGGGHEHEQQDAQPAVLAQRDLLQQDVVEVAIAQHHAAAHQDRPDFEQVAGPEVDEVVQDGEVVGPADLGFGGSARRRDGAPSTAVQSRIRDRPSSPIGVERWTRPRPRCSRAASDSSGTTLTEPTSGVIARDSSTNAIPLKRSRMASPTLPPEVVTSGSAVYRNRAAMRRISDSASARRPRISMPSDLAV